MLAQIQLQLFVLNYYNSARGWQVHVRVYKKPQHIFTHSCQQSVSLSPLTTSVATLTITTTISSITTLLFTSLVNSDNVGGLSQYLRDYSLQKEGLRKKDFSISGPNVVSTHLPTVLSQGLKYVICFHMYVEEK